MGTRAALQGFPHSATESRRRIPRSLPAAVLPDQFFSSQFLQVLFYRVAVDIQQRHDIEDGGLLPLADHLQDLCRYRRITQASAERPFSGKASFTFCHFPVMQVDDSVGMFALPLPCFFAKALY